jgi:hypothetical protein
MLGLLALFCLLEAAPAPQPRDIPTAVAAAIAAEVLIAKGEPTTTNFNKIRHLKSSLGNPGGQNICKDTKH